MFNNITLVGRLVADPELRITEVGAKPVTVFCIAVDRRYKQGEERKTDFIDIVAWHHNAEFITKYFKKGSMIAINGELQTRFFEDKYGNKRKAVEVIAKDVSFCGSSGKKEAKEELEQVDPPLQPMQMQFDDLPF